MNRYGNFGTACRETNVMVTVLGTRQFTYSVDRDIFSSLPHEKAPDSFYGPSSEIILHSTVDVTERKKC
jgi:hypothetical protein